MRRFLLLGLLVALVLTACGGDDSGSDAEGDGGNATTSNGGDDLDLEDLGFDRDFDTGDLPDGFPTELVPPSYVAGQAAELGGITTVSYYSELSFDEALDTYEATLGAPIVTGDPGQRVAIWTQTSDWAVGLFEEDPLLITFTEIPT